MSRTLAVLALSIAILTATVLPSKTSFVEAKVNTESDFRPSPDWIVTPFGYANNNCVYSVGNAHVFKNGTVLTSEGSLLTPPTCSEANNSTIISPSYGGWVEDAGWTSSVSVQNFSGYWQVPPAPTTNSGQVIYLFIGLQPSTTSGPIVQPVLQWGNNNRYGGAYWVIASWVFLNSGNLAYGNVYTVNSLDTIYGLTEGSVVWNNSYCNAFPVPSSCACTSGSCSWWVYTWDTSQPTSDYSLVSSQNCNFNTPTSTQWVFNTLEVYNLQWCSDYPSGGETTFWSLSLRDSSGNTLNPQWQSRTYSTSGSDNCV